MKRAERYPENADAIADVINADGNNGRRAYRQFFDLSRMMSGCPHLAEDIVQRSLMSMWRKGATYIHPVDRTVPMVEDRYLMNWGKKIVKNNTLDCLIARGKFKEKCVFYPSQFYEKYGWSEESEENACDFGSLDDEPLSEILNGEEGRVIRDAVRKAVSELPEGLRMTVQARYFSGMSYEEISSQFGLPAGTVKSRLNKAKIMLHSALWRFRQLA